MNRRFIGLALNQHDQCHLSLVEGRRIAARAWMPSMRARARALRLERRGAEPRPLAASVCVLARLAQGLALIGRNANDIAQPFGDVAWVQVA
jgi:hypothetical protein